MATSEQNVPLLVDEDVDIDLEDGEDTYARFEHGSDHYSRGCWSHLRQTFNPIVCPCGKTKYRKMVVHPDSEHYSNSNGSLAQTDSADFEDVLDQTGHFGWYQVWVVFLMLMTDAGAGMAMLYFIFSNAVPMWRCTQYRNDELGVSDIQVWRNVSGWSKDMEHCQADDGSHCVEYEFSGEFTSIVSEWELLCDMKYAPKMTVTWQFVGLLIGAAVSGHVADKFGRKWTGVGFNVGLTISNLLVGFSPNWIFFSVFRAFVGFFAAGIMGIFFTFPNEVVGPSWRVLVSNLEFFSLGHIVMSLLAMWLQNWRHLAWAIALFPLPFTILIAICVPESPRWLIQKRRFAEATDIVQRMAYYNGRKFADPGLIPRVYASEAHEAEKMAESTYLDLFRGREMALRTLAIGFFWFSISEMYYGIIVLISSFPGSLYINSIISAASLFPVRFGSIPIMTWVPRKTCVVIFGVLSIASMVIVLAVFGAGVPKDSYWITGIALTGKAFVTCLWGVTGLMTVELYPTLMRNKGVGASSTVSRLGGMLAPQIALLGMVTHWTIPYIVHLVLMLAATTFAMIILPETISKPLPEHTPGHERVVEHDQSPTHEMREFDNNGGGMLLGEEDFSTEDGEGEEAWRTELLLGR